jgi:predicted O-methyltransferase YrrM
MLYGNQKTRTNEDQPGYKKGPKAEDVDMGVYLKYKDLFPHLDFDTNIGWGYLPPSDEVFNCINWIRDNIKPRKMLEIGYYYGHSTSYWGEILRNCEIVSCGPDHHKFIESRRKVQMKYEGRIDCIGVKSPDILTYLGQPDKDMEFFPFVFIDGSHHAEAVFSDVHVALRLKAQWILFDNASNREVRQAIRWWESCGVIEKYKEWEYLGLCREKTRINDLTLYKVVKPHFSEIEPFPTPQRKTNA